MQQVFGDCGPRGPITAVECVAMTCSDISAKVHVRRWRRAQCSLMLHVRRNINQAKGDANTNLIFFSDSHTNKNTFENIFIFFIIYS